MTATNIQVLTLQVQNPDFAKPGEARWSELPGGATFQQNLPNSIVTLSTTNAPNDDDVSGLLYFPQLTASQLEVCPEANDTNYIPRNVTHRADLPVNYELLALAPWFPDNHNCTLIFMEAVAGDLLAAMIMYQPSNSSDAPPAPNDPSWALDGGEWKKKYQFPVYAVPGVVGATWMLQLGAYSGNATAVPQGHDLINSGLVSTTDYVRLIADVSTAGSGGVPSLWVFLLMVVAILIIIIGATSCLMHCIARRRRSGLRRRVITGEVDLEALGIKRLRVPQEVLDKMPKYQYNGQYISAAPTPAIEASDPIAIMPVPQQRADISKEISSSTAAPTALYHQQTCAICLDDFVSPSTSTSQPPHISNSVEESKELGAPRVSETSEAASKEGAPTTDDVEEPSIVRELPCGHIFHADCVDPFLTTHSSLCPLCKKSSLPTGFVPRTITNNMVRRERQVRILRGRGVTTVRSGINIDNTDITTAAAAGPDTHTFMTPMERIMHTRVRGRFRVPQTWRAFSPRLASRTAAAHRGDSELQTMTEQQQQQPRAAAHASPAEMVAERPGSNNGSPADVAQLNSGRPGSRAITPLAAALPPLDAEEEEAQDGSGVPQRRRPPWWRGAVRKVFPIA